MSAVTPQGSRTGGITSQNASNQNSKLVVNILKNKETEGTNINLNNEQ
jgi:hypothetical protein